MNEVTLQDSSTGGDSKSGRASFPKLTFPIALVVVYWVLWGVAGAIEKPYFHSFLFAMASSALFTLLFLIWWWFNRRLRWTVKLLGFAVVFGGAWLTGMFSHKTVGIFTLLATGVPLTVSVLVAWMVAAQRRLVPNQRAAAAALALITWSGFLLIRIDGVDSALKSQIRWRWRPTAEERFLAKAKPMPTPEANRPGGATTLTPGPLDWTEFRGTNRDGIIRATRIKKDWKTEPPVAVWQQPVGPAWSSMILVADRLFTQEQRGDQETVVCYEASTGLQVWVHSDTARFEEAVSGIGPRATPTFAEGRLFTFGATGILNCLDAATGKISWSRDIKTDSGAKAPLWGFSSSPLVAGGRVIVYAGGTQDKGLLAYQADSGKLLWAVPAGESSYSSAQSVTLAGVPQVLMLHDGGLSGFDPATGKELWRNGAIIKGAPRCGQPRPLGGDRLLVGALDGAGTSLIAIARTNETWNVSRIWASRDLKPEFPDFVVHDGHAYGFDVSIFSCLDLSTGKRTWKEGRFGRGQVILLPDEQALLISSETGDLVLLALDPSAYRELGRFKALDGKTWNHPVVLGDRIYVRNAEQMACYRAGGGPIVGAVR